MPTSPTTISSAQNGALKNKLAVFRHYQKQATDLSRKNRLLKYPKRAVGIDFEISLEEFKNQYNSITNFTIELLHKAILRDELENEQPHEEKLDVLEEDLLDTTPSGRKLITQLDSLRLKAKRNFEEHGLHTLFMTFGEIQWKEPMAGRGSAAATNTHDFSAPLLLVPIIIENKQNPKRSVIKAQTDFNDVVINPILCLLMERQYEISAPNVSKDLSNIFVPEIMRLLKKFQARFTEAGIQATVIPRIRLGQYSFHGQQIYEDLLKNEKGIIQHEFIDGLIGGGQLQQADENLLEENEENIDSFLTAEEDFTVLDADESQLKAIRQVLNGKHMVIHGPPGTGKSQTIANLIANLLARDKKILFVCEKQVALKIVFDRLKKVGLDGLCLPLFQYNADKKLFAKNIIEDRKKISKIARESRKYIREDPNGRLLEREDKIDYLRKYANALIDNVEPLGKSVYWVHGELAKAQLENNGISLSWGGPDVTELPIKTYHKLCELFAYLSPVADLHFVDEDYPWKRVQKKHFSPDYVSRVINVLERLESHVKSFPIPEDAHFGRPDNIKTVRHYLDSANSIERITQYGRIPVINVDHDTIRETANLWRQANVFREEYEKLLKRSKKNFSIPYNWDKDSVALNLEDIKDNLFIKNIEQQQSDFQIIADKIDILRASISNIEHSSDLLSMSLKETLEYQTIVLLDPIVQRIASWDERHTLQLAYDKLTLLKSVFQELEHTRDIFKRWVILPEEISREEVPQIEERFAGYKPFLRFFSRQYKRDRLTIERWCAHRPQKHSEFVEVISGVADLTRLEKRLNVLLKEFSEEHGKDGETFGENTILRLYDSVSYLLAWFQHYKREKVPDAALLLINSTENQDRGSYEKIFPLLLDIRSAFDLFANTVNIPRFVDSTSVEDVLHKQSEWIEGLNKVLLSYNTISSLLPDNESSQTVTELKDDIAMVDQLYEVIDNLRSLNIKQWFDDEEHGIHFILNDEEGLSNLRQVFDDVLNLIFHDSNISISPEEFYEAVAKLKEDMKMWRDWFNDYDTFLHELSEFFENKRSLEHIEEKPLGEHGQIIHDMKLDKQGLERWMLYQKYSHQIKESGHRWFLDEIRRRNIHTTNLQAIFVQSLWNKWLDEHYQSNDVLKDFNVNEHEQTIAEFRNLEEGIFTDNVLRILQAGDRNIQQVKKTADPMERTLIRESQKKQRHIPIRQLVQTGANHIMQYKPCWMMSPLTLSSYIPYNAAEFDVVIFDEASQMRVEYALGAIARAKQVVVIGDEHQLPPTSFFEVVEGEDEDAEDLEEVGYESILHASKAVLPGPEGELLYHYRSKHEDLIAFSNHRIYDDQLITFPSPDQSERSVHFEYVKDGVYDVGATRRNRIEANRVVRLCVKHIDTDPKLSLGVIALSKAQEDAIRDALSEEIKKRPELAEMLDETSNRKEAFFIKNLESVQGDERDVIILSVGYGPDKNDRIFNRFGPINSAGGYRRLNVAVTRAKEKVICVSSMHAHQMNPSSGARGAKLLQQYLDYAENGLATLDASKLVQNGDGEPDSEFEESVRKNLEGRGYVLHSQVGASGFKIDLAIVDPDSANKYILAVECDGATYHSSPSARIRDRLRQDILEDRGWKIYRVWSQHWISHSQDIVDDIIRTIS